MRPIFSGILLVLASLLFAAPAFAVTPAPSVELSPQLTWLLQTAVSLIISSGAGAAVVVFGLKAFGNAEPKYKPVIQKSVDYLEYIELQAIHLAELAGVNMNVGGQAKLKMAVDTVINLATQAGYKPETLSANDIEKDIEALLPKVYPPKK